MRSIKYFTVLAFAVAVTAIAQSPLAFPESPQLFETVAQLDARMFGAFNAHDVDLLMSMFTDDMEFYHDKGRTDQSRADARRIRENVRQLSRHSARTHSRFASGLSDQRFRCD